MGGGGIQAPTFTGGKSDRKQTFLGASANPIGAALRESGVGNEQELNVLLDPGGFLTEQTFFQDQTLDLPTPTSPELNQITQAEITAESKRAREEERKRREAANIRARTIKTGPRGLQTTPDIAFENILGR